MLRAGWPVAAAQIPAGNLTALLDPFLDTLSGAVLYDPLVPATSNVASTVAGVEGMVPVCNRPGSHGASVYSQLVGSKALKVGMSLVGKFTGARTHSKKNDAYLWAKETYLDTGKTNPLLLAYYVDYFAAGYPVPPGPPGPPPGPGPTTRDHLTPSGKPLARGGSLTSSNGQFILTLRNDCNLQLQGPGPPQGKVLWQSRTSTPTNTTDCELALTAVGNLLLRTTAGEVLWQTKTHGAAGAFLWCQHDGNLVLYKGVYPAGSGVLWASNTAEQSAVCAPASSGAGRARRGGRYAAHTANGALREGGGDVHTAKTTNHDYFVANKGFFFDLSIWSDETPNDDPYQPLGTDRATLLAIMRSAYNQSNGTSMIHLGGSVTRHPPPHPPPPLVG